MENVQPDQILIPLAAALVIGVLWLIWGERPDLADTIRLRLGRRQRPAVVNSYAAHMSSAARYEDDEDDDENDDLHGSERTGSNGSEAFARDGTERTPAFGSEPLNGFALSAEELIAVQKMNHYLLTTAQRGQQPSKSAAIQAGFGLKRGGGPRYTRAALVYDTLFGQPEPAVKFVQPDGSLAPGSYPMSGRQPARTRAR